MSSKLTPGITDTLIRSRKTILDVLEDRGYDTKVYQNISPEQIVALAEGSSRALDIVVKRRQEKPSPTCPCDRAIVMYSIHDNLITKIRKGDYLPQLFETDSVITKADDVIIIINEPYNESFDKASLQMWQNSKIRVCFFHIKQMVTHLGRHSLVPPHRKLTADEAKVEINRLYISIKSQFPLIKHSDIQARLLGLVPGDLVEILRPSQTSGVNRVLRICAA